MEGLDGATKATCAKYFFAEARTTCRLGDFCGTGQTQAHGSSSHGRSRRHWSLTIRRQATRQKFQ